MQGNGKQVTVNAGMHCTSVLLAVQLMLVLGNVFHIGLAHLVLHGRRNDSRHVACCCSDASSVASSVALALLHIV